LDKISAVCSGKDENIPPNHVSVRTELIGAYRELLEQKDQVNNDLGPKIRTPNDAAFLIS
jgi:hypothetical protein